MEKEERRILEELDARLAGEGVRERIDEIVDRVERALAGSPDEVMAWEPIPLDLYGDAPPGGVRSSWVFVLRAGATTGAERHPNSRQRMVSWRGSGDFQMRPGEEWCSHRLRPFSSEAPLEERWISIPPNVWHQGVVSSSSWTVVSFQTASVDELVEERPDVDGEGEVRRRKYVE